ncbi:right-handed parallel beta-helix repeat-containing protein, partial [Candidatus Woesearchaeota archaeon]|nr:right-handed parallel beta-helix repeat-containing protein [Candidatus Woesearchaeota archaeon]
NNLSNNKVSGSSGSGIHITSNNNILIGNNATNNSNCGIELSGGNNNTLTNGVMTTNTITGLCIANSDDNNISGISFSGNPTGLKISSSENNILTNLSSFVSNPTSIHLVDSFSSSIGDSDFPSNSIFETTSFGRINYTQDTNFTAITLLSDVMHIILNDIRADASAVPGLNRTAILTFTGLSINFDPEPIVDFEEDGSYVDCPASICTEINYTSNTFTYNVTHFTNYSPEDVPPGNLSNGQITVPSTVTPTDTFQVECSFLCQGERPCTNITATLDPIRPLINLTEPNNVVHSVFTDSDFLFASTEDGFVHVWNKTTLSLFTNISVNPGNQIAFVIADSDYIYASDRWNSFVSVFNRTDLTTPFANLRNISIGSAFGRSLAQNEDYLFIGTDEARIEVINKTIFTNVRNLTNVTRLVRDMDVHSNILYAVDHNCNFFIYNISDNFGSRALSTPTNCGYGFGVSVDDEIILAVGQDSSGYGAWARVWNKTNDNILYDYDDFSNDIFAGVAAYHGSPGDLAYYGGSHTDWSTGWLRELNKSTWAVTDEQNYSNYIVKDLFCDELYLYGAINIGGSSGAVALFNNSCGSFGAVPPTLLPTVFINSLSIVPSQIPRPSSAYCTANITTNGTSLDTVQFNLTGPDGTSVILNSTNVSSIFNSSNFSVTSTADHTCTLFVNDTTGSNATASTIAYVGLKGVIPMNSGSPFYTTTQNPLYPQNVSCLNSTAANQTCSVTWNVTANATLGDTWSFFCIFDSGTNATRDTNTSRSDVLISIPSGAAAVTRSSGGGGSGWNPLYASAETVHGVEEPEVIAPIPAEPKRQEPKRPVQPKAENATSDINGRIGVDGEFIKEKVYAAKVVERFSERIIRFKDCLIFLIIALAVALVIYRKIKEKKRKKRK